MPPLCVDGLHAYLVCSAARQVMKKASERVFVPLTVGGGIRDFTDSTGR